MWRIFPFQSFSLQPASVSLWETRCHVCSVTLHVQHKARRCGGYGDTDTVILLVTIPSMVIADDIQAHADLSLLICRS